MIRFGLEACSHLILADGLEWLVCNGLVTYASGSIGVALTRSKHGLPVAAIIPPGDSRLLLDHLDETVEQDGEVRLDLSGNLCQGGCRSPDAARWIERFELGAGLPRWIFSGGDL